MTSLPRVVDFRKSEAAAVAKARAVAPVQATEDPLDVNTALKCMSAFQFLHEPEELAQLDDEKTAAPLVASARILLSTAQHLRKTGIQTAENLDHLAFHAAIAYAMHGNFPSAKAALSEVSTSFIEAAVTFKMLAFICDPSGPMAQSPTGGELELFRQTWYRALREEKRELREHFLRSAIDRFVRTAVGGTTVEMALTSMGRMAALQAARLATANLYLPSTGVPRWFIKNTIESGLVTLLPPQLVLLMKERLPAQRGNALLTLPTSTGKTFVAEACIAADLANCRPGELCVYVAPYVAIGNQVVASFEKRMKGAATIVSMFGGFKFDGFQPSGKPKIVVATPERFDALLRAGGIATNLRTVVFDEIHILENGHRGARVEGMVSRLRLLQRTNAAIRLVCLSAVLSEPEKVGQWLDAGGNTHQIGWRPTARRLALCDSNGQMEWIYGRDVLLPEQAQPWDSISSPVRITLPGRISRVPFSPSDENNGARNVAAVAIDLLSRLSGPGLVVCQKKADTRLLARHLAQLAPAQTDAAVHDAAAQILQRYSWLGSLCEYLKVGIAYHNAALPHDVRRSIEELTRERKLRVVCATTTLAEGADLPFRWTLVAHWQSWDGKPMKSMTFRNIAGRCGRAGAFSEGDTVLFENLVGVDRKEVWTDKARLSRVMFSSSPLQSTLSEAGMETESSIQPALDAAFGSQLLACIGEHPEMNDVVHELTKSSYASISGGDAALNRVLQSTLADLLDAEQPGGAFAVANSPVRLTAVGVAANRSGFSPATCRRMAAFLARSEFPTAPTLYALLLKEFYDIPEQSEDNLRKVLSGATHRNVVKASNLEKLLSSVLEPKDLRQVFESLRPSKSKAQPDFIERQFEGFVQLVETVIGHFLPWLLRGLQTLAPFGSTAASEVEWSEMARAIESKLVGAASSNDDLGADAEPF